MKVLVSFFVGALAAVSAPAQVDPLLFLKGTRPNVLIGLDLSSRMQREPGGAYLDPVVFDRTNAAFETTLRVPSTVTASYRRRYIGLDWRQPTGAERAASGTIEVVGDADAAFAELDGRTRLGRARAAIRHAVEGSSRSVRFGLDTTRQARPRIETATWQVIAVGDGTLVQPTDTGQAGRWRAGIPVVDAPGAGAGATRTTVAADSAGANEALSRLLLGPAGAAGALLPAGYDTPDGVDAPLGLLLDDLRAEAARLVAADGSCANTVVILVTAGGDPSLGVTGLGDRAAAFLAITGRRVPVHVVAIAPSAAEVPQLALVAARSGGRYVEVPAEAIERVPPGDVVPEIVNAVNWAVQHAFLSFADLNTAPSATYPCGPPSYFPTASPVVGTLNLQDAVDAAGRPLPNARVSGPFGGVLPQPSNVLVSAGFELPGFLGRLSAFRVYRPVADSSQATGYRFTADGTRLWTARTPVPARRNIYTVLPGAGVVAFHEANASLLAPYLRAASPARLIAAVRGLPLGAIVNSTPALLEPPSGPLVDAGYLAFVERNRRRRALVFVGAGDGMMHAVDARTGLEVWAVIPFNLLPKLRELPEGASIDGFTHLVEGSPRVADVKVDGTWRTFLLFGEGAGGTFYQAFDVTLDGIDAAVPPDSDPVAPLLDWFSSPRSIPFGWSFPRYEPFDPSIAPWGDLGASATDLEKSVGETWSTPAVGRVAGRFVAVVGSGRLAAARERQAHRGGVKAGTRVYLLDMGSGVPLDSRDVGSDGIAESGGDCPSDGCSTLKNALQADPLVVVSAATGELSRAYLGDLDGRLWRFDLAGGGFHGDPRLVFAAGADQPILSSVALLTGTAGVTHLFVATGSDLLPRGQASPAYRLIGLAELSATVVRRFELVLRTQAAGGADEGAAGAPSVASGVAFFATNSAQRGSRCAAVEADLYALTIAGGAAYDANGDGRRDSRDGPVVARVRAGRATAPTVADRHVHLATGDRFQLMGDEDGFGAGPAFLGVRVLSWAEVR